MKKDNRQIERHYSPAGAAGTVLGYYRSFFSNFRIAHSLGFLFALRNFKARYRYSMLGFLWAFLVPLSTSIVWIILQRQRVVDFGPIPVAYPVFVVIGTTLWQVFAASVTGPLGAVNSSRGILTKVNFPREAVLVTAFYEILLNVIIGTVIIALVILVTGTHVDVGVWKLIPGVLSIILMGMCIGLLLMPVSLLYNDIQYAMPAALQFLMYLTPVVYPKPIFGSGGVSLNPVGAMLQFARAGILGYDSGVSVTSAFLILGGALLLFLLCLVLFKTTLEVLIERMG